MFIMKRIIIPFFYVFLCTIACEKAPEEVAVASVSIGQASAEMLIGETVQLSASVQPSDATDKALTWTSSKQSVATVSSSGLVTAIAEGNSTITASAGGKSATCAVIVSKGTVAVSSITLDKESLELVEGNTATLTVTVKPDDATDKTVTWSSSDATVASVDNGKVTAIKEGTTSIIAKAGDKTAECKVTVVKKVIAVTSIELNKTNLELVEGESETLIATVKPNDATDKTVEWSAFNEAVAKVENGIVFAIHEGTTTITAKAGEEKAKCEVTVKKNPQNEPIQFADSNLKAILVSSFDKDGDGEISKKEAETVEGTELFAALGSQKFFSSFNELEYFTKVTSIPNEGFKGWQIEAITLPWTVESIGYAAFESCVNLKSIKIPDGVSTLPNKGFYNCLSLTEVVFGASIKIIGWQCFKNCSALESIDLPSTITSLGTESFSCCTKLKRISLPSQLSRIPGEFARASAIESIVLPATIETIEYAAFEDCEKLTEIIIPASVKSISYAVFENCKSLKSVIIPDSVTEIGYRVFKGCSSLESVRLPNSMIYIPISSFHGCSSLKSITLPESIVSIQNSAFANSGIETISLPSALRNIEYYTFYGCKQLKSISIPDNVTYIGETAFANCSLLETVTIPAKVESIGYGAFYYCISLKEIIVLPTTPPSVFQQFSYSGMFDNTNDSPIYVPAESIDAYKAANGWEKYSSRIQAIGAPMAIDLGLSVRWVSWNLGADSPEENGDYFAWGESSSKQSFDWSNYKWDSSSTSITKYVMMSNYGSVDNKYKLEDID